MEFTDLDLHRGFSMGRIPLSSAVAGSFVYAITDENQAMVDITVPGAYTEVYQTVDVTTLTAIVLRLQHRGSPDSTWRITVSLGGSNAYREDLPPGSPLVPWRFITVACGKLAGPRVLAVTVGILS
jgi:hypothetical protein